MKDRRVAFLGKLGGLTKKEAMQMVREHGGVACDRISQDIDLIVIGADHPSGDDPRKQLDADSQEKIATGELELLHETELWERLGYVDDESSITQLNTPAMLADLLNVPVANVRRWQKMGLITPCRVVHRLPYFDFSEVRTARQLASWMKDGASLTAIHKQIRELAKRFPDEQRSLAQLNVVIEGGRLLLREEDGLMEADGQLRMDFDSFEETGRDEDLEDPKVLHVNLAAIRSVADQHHDQVEMSLEQMVEAAQDLEDDGDLSGAIEWYRVVLAKFGPRAEIHFQLAELLYREGEIQAARERYYSAIELDEDFVEARANLGCVLMETGRTDLAIAAFRGALARHDDYPDVHYHLAQALDEIESTNEASFHWGRFLELAPSSPWAEEARDRLGNSTLFDLDPSL